MHDLVGKVVSEEEAAKATEEDGRKLDLFPISEPLRYRLPFSPAHEVVGYLESLADEEGPMKIKVGAEVRKMARDAIKSMKLKDGSSNADVGAALEKSKEAQHALLFCARTSTCMYPELEFVTKGEKD